MPDACLCHGGGLGHRRGPSTRTEVKDFAEETVQRKIMQSKE